MNRNQPSLEAELRGLQASPLDDDFLHRLESCAEGTWASLRPDEVRFEDALRKLKAAKLDATFLAKLEEIVHEVPFSIDEKIVLFPKPNQISQKREHRTKRPFLAAAAAVAILGGVSALMIPVSHPARFANTPPLRLPPSPVAGIAGNISPSNSMNYAPASFNRGVSEVHDEGMVWKSNQPHSLLRVVYKDKITVTDKDGRTYQVENPREGYMLVPAKTD